MTDTDPARANEAVVLSEKIYALARTARDPAIAMSAICIAIARIQLGQNHRSDQELADGVREIVLRFCSRLRGVNPL